MRERAVIGDHEAVPVAVGVAKITDGKARAVDAVDGYIDESVGTWTTRKIDLVEKEICLPRRMNYSAVGRLTHRLGSQDFCFVMIERRASSRDLLSSTSAHR